MSRIFFVLRCLLVLVGLACCPSRLVAGVTINGDVSGSIRDLPNTGGFVVYNQGSTPLTFGFTNSAGVYWSSSFDTGHSASPSFVNAPTYPDFTVIDAVGASGAVTIPAGERWFFQSIYRVRMAAGDVGSHTVNFTTWYRVGGAAAVSRSVSVPVNVVSGGANSYSGTSGANAPGVGATYKYANGATVAAGGITAIWDTLTIGSVTPFGKVTLAGGVNSFVRGNVEVFVKINGVTVAVRDQVPVPPTNAFYQMPADWVAVNTSNPSTYSGQTLTVWCNSRLMYSDPITPDVNGNWDIYLESSSLESESYPQRIENGAGELVPTPGDSLTNAPPSTETEPPPMPPSGATSVADPTVQTTGTGPSGGLSPKDVYAAVRAGVRDAANEGGTETPDFDFNAWAGESPMESAAGEEVGSAMGQGLGALMGQAEAAAVNLPGLGGADPWVISVMGHSATVPVFSGASLLRSFFLVVLAIYVFWSAVDIVKSAFAGK